MIESNNSIDSLDELFDEISSIKVLSNKLFTKIEDINNLHDAESILNEKIVFADNESLNDRTYKSLRHIIKAINYLDNKGVIWIPNWKYKEERKYFSWFILDSSGGWSLNASLLTADHSYAVVGYYLNQASCEFISKKFINLYSIILNNQ